MKPDHKGESYSFLHYSDAGEAHELEPTSVSLQAFH